MNVEGGGQATPLTVIGADAGDIAPLRLPDPARVFHARSERFAALAKGHAAAAFLELLASVTRGQHQASREVRIPPGARLLDGVPLDHARWERDPAWRGMLRVVLAACTGGALPAPAREAIARLERAGAAELEALAGDVLAGPPRDLASAPFVGAALQVYFTQLAAGLDPRAVAAAGTGCPVCGSPPVAGVILGTERVRYLVCSLCAVEWHLTRVQCSVCRGAAAISYYSVDGMPAGARAEACDGCKAYLKLFDLQEAPAAEPTADDAATLVLDLLVGERGYRRAGVNLLAPAGEPA
jgi:FdhE protein